MTSTHRLVLGLLAIIVALLVTPLGASAAEAATYKGQTDESGALSFTVKKKKVSNLSVRFVTACANPAEPGNPLIVTMKPQSSVYGVKAKVKKNRRFSFTSDPFFSLSHGLIVVDFKGRLGPSRYMSRKRAAGTVRVRFPGSTIGYPDYADCDTGEMTWGAKR